MIDRVIGNYRIVEKVGEGGMGTVYRAVDLMLEREVAIKAIRPELSREPEIVERFRAEAKMLARLSHPAIATIYSFFVEGEDLFLAMEFVRGRSLSRLLRDGGPLPWERAVPLLALALDGIEQAHRAGIVHRDLKSDNLMITEWGAVKVMDFGIARLIGGDRLTRTGLLVGTLHYMAPEQIRGEEVDRRTDVYALGAVLYEMLTGRVPFEGDSDYAVLKKHVEEHPPPPSAAIPGLPSWLDQAILKALAKEPGQRFQSVEELRLLLLGQGSPVAPGAGAMVVPIADQPTLVRLPAPEPGPWPEHPSPSPSARPAAPRAAAAGPGAAAPPGSTAVSGTTLAPPPAPPALAAPPRQRPEAARGRRPALLAALAVAVVIIASVLLYRQLASPPSSPRAAAAGGAGARVTRRGPGSGGASLPAAPGGLPAPAANGNALPAAPAGGGAAAPPDPGSQPAPTPAVAPPGRHGVGGAPAAARSEASAATAGAGGQAAGAPAAATAEPGKTAGAGTAAAALPIVELRQLGSELAGNSGRLRSLYTNFLAQKQKSGSRLTPADDRLKDELKQLDAAAADLRAQFQGGLLARTFSRVGRLSHHEDERGQVTRLARAVVASGSRADALMTQVKPNAAVRQLWRHIRRQCKRIAEISEA